MPLKEYVITLVSYLKNKDKRQLINLSFKLKGKIGLEIGGPSDFFRLMSYFPVYLFAERIDGVNYSAETVWEGSIAEGNTYNYYKNENGYQYINEASELRNIKSSSYDFVLSSHSLEHVANPLKALSEWKRVLRQKGILVIILPKKESTFDHKRDYTTFEHLLDDYKNDIQENDATHFEEIIKLHDVSRDPGLSQSGDLTERTLENYKNRCVHHHVFNFQLIRNLLEYSGFSVLHQQEVHDFHLVTVAQVNHL